MAKASTGELLERLRDRARRRKVQFMDARLFEEQRSSVSVQDGKADKVSQSQNAAAGVRVLVDGAWGFASTDVITAKSLGQCLDAALSMAAASSGRVLDPGAVASLPAVRQRLVQEVGTDPRSVSVEEKMRRTLAYEKAGIDAAGGKLCNTLVSYRDAVTRETVCNTAGTLVEQEVTRTGISTAMTAADGATRQMGHEHFAERAGFELLDRTSPEDLTVKAAKRAVALLSAKRAPSGKFPVVLHPSITGLLAHEALGHNAEADLVFEGGSIIEGKIGQRIAAECVSILDDPTLPAKLNGSYAYDSEGTPARRHTVVENGVLVGYLHSLETASRFGAEPGGSGRAMNGHCQPVVRMSNTFIGPGKSTFEEMIAGIDLGIYMKGGHWGYVFCERGQYTCHAGEGWMIRGGKLAEHLRDVSFSGMTLETLLNIDAVAGDVEFLMPGMCGKSGQGMHINAGGPHVRVREVVVGGQE